MTREDAILHMTLRREELKHSVGDLDEDIEAFDMAIQALEQEPCDDAISRQAALSLVSDGREGLGNIIYASDVECLPSVSTEKLDKAKSEIRYGENKAYNADFTMGCEYAISVIERMFEEIEE